MTRSQVVGVLGAGQLGRMIALAGYALGDTFLFLDPAPDACAGQIAPLVCAPFNDHEALERLARACDVITLEFENVPVEAVRAVAAWAPVHPGPRSLETAQDRLAEKRLFERLGLATPRFAAADDEAGLDAALGTVGLPAVIKTRRLGYDGRGQLAVRGADDAEGAWDRLGGVPLIVEELIPFDREVSAVAVRAQDGSMAHYPLAENRHAEGILRTTTAPADAPHAQADAARDAAAAVAAALDHVGALALELFDHGGRLLVNELAPRVHNTGHWTIEGAVTSQFENHLRAVTGRPLGPTSAVGRARMDNLIGSLDGVDELLATPGAHVHLYGKEPRPARKLGHVTSVELEER
jgi:5-(carboxyamino)imidazole ribonucleotide synthase